MKRINDCTLVCIDCSKYGASVDALQKSMAQNEFDKVIFFTDVSLELEGIEVKLIPSIKSKEQYSHFCIKELYKHIDTKYVLIIQWDGYTLNGDLFDDSFYDYDYIGATWTNETDGFNVGNGGYSFRSKKLLDAVGKDENIIVTHPEDAQICRTYRPYLESKYGIKFAPVDIADKFSFELGEPTQPTMGFHSFFHQPYRPTVIVKRTAALGDVILIEPLLRYYAAKGYNVVVDIPIQYFELFNQHYFPVKHISQFDEGRIKPEKVINLDMSYEVKPIQTYLKTYFEFAGITDYQLSKPKLFPYVDEKTKLFKKYAVVHIDQRNDTPERNVNGVNWKAVERYLVSNGYVVLQIGMGLHESCGIEINTPTVGFMKFVIAGCDLFLGIDSAPAHIALAYNKKSVLFYGSTNPNYIHCDLTNVEIVQAPCDNSFCWHYAGGTSGKTCKYIGTDKYLQCTKTDSDTVIDKIYKLISNE